MNKRLKFSWGHIIAFLALIFIAYVTFMGITYLTLGDFIKAGVGCAVCVLLLAVSILGAQIQKGAPNRFYKHLVWERILLLVSPMVLLLAFFPYNHFWTVLSQEDEIVSNFNNAIKQAHGILDEYEKYAQDRCNNLSFALQSLSDDKKHNRVEELHLLLLSQNYENLKKESKKWIDNAAQSSTVWNVFLLGNVEDIKDAVEKWTNELHDVSTKHLSCETEEIQDFDSNTPAKQRCINGLESLKNEYSDKGFQFNAIALVTMFVCWLMLMLPYFIQERHAANCEKFWDFWPFSNFYGAKGAKESFISYLNVESPNKSEAIKAGYTTINEVNQEKKENKPKTRKGAPV